MNTDWDFTIAVADQMWDRPVQRVDPRRYVPKLWKKQGGKCAATGMPMRVTRGPVQLQEQWMSACAVDLLNRQYGYSKGNMRLVCADIAEQRSIYDFLTYPFRSIRSVAHGIIDIADVGKEHKVSELEYIVWTNLISALKSNKSFRHFPMVPVFKQNAKTISFQDAVMQLDFTYHSWSMIEVFVTDMKVVITRHVKHPGDPNSMHVSLLANSNFIDQIIHAMVESTRLAMQVVFSGGTGYQSSYIKPLRKYGTKIV